MAPRRPRAESPPGFVAARARRWTVRARSAVAAALVVTVGMAAASTTMLWVLYQSLARSTQAAAETRSAQLAEQLREEYPTDLDPGLLGTDGQIGAIQLLDRSGAVIARSAGAPARPLAGVVLPPGDSVSVGQVQTPDDGGDYWVTARGATTPGGPVTVVVGGDREPVETVVVTVGLLLAVSGPLVVALVAGPPTYWWAGRCDPSRRSGRR